MFAVNKLFLCLKGEKIIMLDIQQLSIETAVLSYAVFGKGAIDMVIEMGLGSCIGEWWHVAERLSKSHTILLYERAG